MAYANVLTGTWNNGDFVVFTRKQAGVVYAAYKRGNVRMTSKQVNHLYRCVGTQDMTYDAVCGFICEGRLDLAQAILDGHKVEAYEVERVIREEVDPNDLFAFAYEDGYVERTETEIRYRIVA